MTEPTENIAQTLMGKLPEMLDVTPVALPDDDDLSMPQLVAVPHGRDVKDMHSAFLKAAETHAPLQRRGTARFTDLGSFCNWVNRFKDDDSAIFGTISTEPCLTAIIDYHRAGPPILTNGRDDTARHGKHRGHYAFPLSQEWRDWSALTGTEMTGPEMGEFIESHAKDLLNPTPAMLGTGAPTEQWEHDLIEVAAHLKGTFATFSKLQNLSRDFTVNEISNLSVSYNRDSGEQMIQFFDEHRDPDGQPIKLPNLCLIAIPVFENGAHYRIPVQFRYRKKGANVAFSMAMYDPKRVLRNAVEEAFDMAQAETEITILHGTPETV